MEFEEAFSVGALMDAHEDCRRNKQHKKEVIDFEMNLSVNLTRLSRDVINNKYKIGTYRMFYVYEPKKRVIESLAYRHRLVQMCLCKFYLEQAIEKKLIYDNCACRKGKGTHFAMLRLEKFLKSYYAQHGSTGYYLKCDIKKFFQNINQDILSKQIASCDLPPRVQALLDQIIYSYNGTGTGVPIGNQTSQWFALIYLNPVDRYIKEVLKIKFYVRYMDDFVLIHHDKEYLKFCFEKIREKVEELKLTLNEKTQICSLAAGIDFLGFNHKIDKNGVVMRRLRQKAKRRLRNNFKKLDYFKRLGLIDDNYVKNRICCFNAHNKFGDCYRLMESLRKKHPSISNR